MDEVRDRADEWLELTGATAPLPNPVVVRRENPSFDRRFVAIAKMVIDVKTERVKNNGKSWHSS